MGAKSRSASKSSKSTLIRKDLPWLADKFGVEVCYLYEDDWKQAVDSGWAVYYFDAAEANRRINFFPLFMTHMKGKLANTPVHLEVWQKELVGRLFGWKRLDNNLRRYRTLFLFVPRKNGKSILSIGLGLQMLLCDNEGGPEVYISAGTEDQADKLFKVAKFQVKKNEDLALLCGKPPGPGAKSLYVENTEGVFTVLSSVADTQEGLNPSAYLCEEYHVHKNSDMYEVMETGMAGREQPLVIIISTAGESKSNNPCFQEYEYAKKVRDGVLISEETATYLPCIYEAPAGAAIDDLEALKVANPNFGVSVFEDYLKRKAHKAIHIPALVNSFRRHHMNHWVDSADIWLEYAKWLQCKLGFDPKELIGRHCYAGLDLASVEDLNALVLLFPPVRKGERYKALPYFWCPEDGIQKRAKYANVPYLQWREAGLLFATPGDCTDYNAIKMHLELLSQIFDIREIGFDPHNATYLTTELAGKGFKCHPMRQGYGLNEAIKGLLTLILSRQLQHDSVILDWMASHCQASIDSMENIKLDKDKSSEKIDGVVALAMAVGRAFLHLGDDYDPFADRGLLAA